jgi:hypothetical protein
MMLLPQVCQLLAMILLARFADAMLAVVHPVFTLVPPTNGATAIFVANHRFV